MKRETKRESRFALRLSQQPCFTVWTNNLSIHITIPLRETGIKWTGQKSRADGMFVQVTRSSSEIRQTENVTLSKFVWTLALMRARWFSRDDSAANIWLSMDVYTRFEVQAAFVRSVSVRMTRKQKMGKSGGRKKLGCLLVLFSSNLFSSPRPLKLKHPAWDQPFRAFQAKARSN